MNVLVADRECDVSLDVCPFQDGQELLYDKRAPFLLYWEFLFLYCHHLLEVSNIHTQGHKNVAKLEFVYDFFVLKHFKRTFAESFKNCNVSGSADGFLPW